MTPELTEAIDDLERLLKRNEPLYSASARVIVARDNAPPRKVIHAWNGHDGLDRCLCDDGTMWWQGGDAKWNPYPLPPGCGPAEPSDTEPRERVAMQQDEITALRTGLQRAREERDAATKAREEERKAREAARKAYHVTMKHLDAALDELREARAKISELRRERDEARAESIVAAEPEDEPLCWAVEYQSAHTGGWHASWRYTSLIRAEAEVVLGSRRLGTPFRVRYVPELRDALKEPDNG